jgi:general secretion pathway protein K
MRRGAAMIAVIWLIAVLALACITTLRVISFDASMTSSRLSGTRARLAAERGIAIAANPAVRRNDPLLSRFDEASGEGYEARFSSEGGRFNLNSLLLSEDKVLLRSLFTDWGLPLDAAQAVTDALGDWVDGDDEKALNGAESEDYGKLGRINQPFNRPFYDINEARMVLGMDLVEELRPDWRNWFTVWSTGPLDINEAEPQFIAAAAECRPEQASIIPETVRGPDGILGTDDDSPFRAPAEALELLGVDANLRPDISRRFTANEQTIRIESIGQADGVRRRITVVIRNRTAKPILLQRTEEILP